jgi:hypothetical protein
LKTTPLPSLPPPAPGGPRPALMVTPAGIPSGRRSPRAPPDLHGFGGRTRQRGPTGGFAPRTLSHPILSGVRHRLPPWTNLLACDASAASPRFTVSHQRRTSPRVCRILKKLTTVANWQLPAEVRIHVCKSATELIPPYLNKDVLQLADTFSVSNKSPKNHSDNCKPQG